MIDWSNSVAIDENQYLLDGDIFCMFPSDIYSNKKKFLDVKKLKLLSR